MRITIATSGALSVTPNTVRRRGESPWIVSLAIPAGHFRLESLSPAASGSETLAWGEVSTRLWSRAGFPSAADARIPEEVYQWAQTNRDALWAAGDDLFPTLRPMYGSLVIP